MSTNQKLIKLGWIDRETGKSIDWNHWRKYHESLRLHCSQEGQARRREMKAA
jgi:hypothetical protein